MIDAEFDNIDKTFCALAEREEELGKSSVNEIERVVLLIWHASGIIGNGGFRYFFECSLSLQDTAKAYDQIGVEQAALVLRKVLNLFPHCSVPEDWDERMALVEDLYKQHEEMLSSLEGDYYNTDKLMRRQLAGWIRVHKDIFDKINLN
jgi:hypothetical protein